MFNIHLPKYERIWLLVGSVTLGIFLVMFAVMGAYFGLNPPGHDQTIDPLAVATTAPFDNPGVRQIGPNEYDVSIVSRMFAFVPGEITLPVGAKVHFKMTSPDVVHGLIIPGTNVNMMIVPGHITQYTYTFKERGEYLLVCHEYCGSGHQLMAGRLIVQ